MGARGLEPAGCACVRHVLPRRGGAPRPLGGSRGRVLMKGFSARIGLLGGQANKEKLPTISTGGLQKPSSVRALCRRCGASKRGQHMAHMACTCLLAPSTAC